MIIVTWGAVRSDVSRGQPDLSIKGQPVNTSAFAVHLGSAVLGSALLEHVSVNVHGCVPIKLYLQTASLWAAVCHPAV
jgi:hypothetical protein